MNKPLLATSIDRRKLLQTAGFLALSFGFPAGRAFAQSEAQSDELPSQLRDNPIVSSWIRIDAEGTVTVAIGKAELGQGTMTAFAQLAAEELYIAWERIRVHEPHSQLAPDQGTTSGSNSMPAGAPAVQYAAAEARQILLNLAAARLDQPLEGMTIVDGTITAANGQSVSYWDLVTGQELSLEATGEVSLKPYQQHTIVGTSPIRLDIPGKMTGEAMFLQEHRPQNLVYGRAVRPPTYQAGLVSVDTARVESMPGVIAVVRNGSFLGVVAERQYQAIRAAEALAAGAQWNVTESLPGHEGIFEWLENEADLEVSEFHDEPREDGPEAARVIEATYYRPYQMHGSIGPSVAIAELRDDGRLYIESHSQAVVASATSIGRLVGMDPSDVLVQHVQGSGCYGHNGADDAPADAALLALAVPGRAVKLQWSRADEHRWEPYGSAGVIKTRAGLDADGNILDWNLDLWSTPHSTRPGNNPGGLLPGPYLDPPFPKPDAGGPGGATRNGDALYTFPGHVARSHYSRQTPLRVSATRSLGAYFNVFAIESFMDECALEAGVDPVEYRLRHLDDERHRDVLIAAAEAFGWDSYVKANPNRGRGIGWARYKNTDTICAVAVEVEINRRNGRIRMIRAVAAADAGHLVHPDNVANQIEGGAIQAFSWTLKEEVKFDATGVRSEDWASYPILLHAEVPPMEVVLINRPGEWYMGAGEASQGPAGAALANAVADAAGYRFRRIPFTPARVLDELAAAGML